MKIIPKSYGSIPHLSTSKLTQQADKKIDPGQEKILLEKVRDKHDTIIVTEKIDGSNVGVIRKNGQLIPITRSGYTCLSSPHKQHHMFDTWVNNRRNNFDFLPEGWRVCGEWCAMSHGTIYDLKNNSPFVVFDIIDDSNKRIPYVETLDLILGKLSTVPFIHIGVGKSIPLEVVFNLLGANFNYGFPGEVEGVVYRCERKGQFDFAAKWVRSDKEDGKYMKQEIYHITEGEL